MTDTAVDPDANPVVDTPVDTSTDPGPGDDPGCDPVDDPECDPVDDPVDDPGDDPGYDPGYDPGHDPGYDPGYDHGYDPGYDVCYDTGHDVSTDGSTCWSGTSMTEYLGFEADYMNLDTGSVERSVYTYPSDSGWDIKIAYNSMTTVHSRVFQNSSNSVEIAHLTGRSFSSVTSCDVPGTTFTTSLIDQPFDTTRVILILTDAGNIYKLGNPSETTSTVTFEYALIGP